jgi:hypothetical protein
MYSYIYTLPQNLYGVVVKHQDKRKLFCHGKYLHLRTKSRSLRDIQQIYVTQQLYE